MFKFHTFQLHVLKYSLDQMVATLRERRREFERFESAPSAPLTMVVACEQCGQQSDRRCHLAQHEEIHHADAGAASDDKVSAAESQEDARRWMERETQVRSVMLVVVCL